MSVFIDDECDDLGGDDESDGSSCSDDEHEQQNSGQLADTQLLTGGLYVTEEDANGTAAKFAGLEARHRTTPAHNRCGSDRTPKSHFVRFFGRSIRSESIMRRLVVALATSSALNHENEALVAYFLYFKRKSSSSKKKKKKHQKS